MTQDGRPIKFYVGVPPARPTSTLEWWGIKEWMASSSSKHQQLQLKEPWHNISITCYGLILHCWRGRWRHQRTHLLPTFSSPLGTGGLFHRAHSSPKVHSSVYNLQTRVSIRWYPTGSESGGSCGYFNQEGPEEIFPLKASHHGRHSRV